MTNSCAIVVCDHGLGHLRRCSLIARALEERGVETTLFAPRASVDHLHRAMPGLSECKVHEFSTGTRPERFKEGLGPAVEWLARLPNLDSYSMVVCDNLPEILERRPDAILSAQFFWHDAVDGTASSYINYCDRLLQKHQSLIVGDGLFTMDAVRNQPGFVPVGLYAAPCRLGLTGDVVLDQAQDLLLTGGTTSGARAQMQQRLDEILEHGPDPFERVYVDPELLPPHAPEWMMAATFTVEMYAGIVAAVCRPGLGVLTDLLAVGARPFVLHEPGNAEMRHNTAVLVEHEIGQPIEEGSGRRWLDVIHDYVVDASARDRQKKRCKRFSSQGACEAADKILLIKNI